MLGGAPGPDDGKIVAVSMFKNGYAVVVRETDLVKGSATLKPPSNAVHGTLWISASKGVTIERAATETVETTSQRDATSIDELLQANFEKVVTLETSQGNGNQNTLVVGRIISVAGPMVVLEGEKDRVALFKSAILRVIAGNHGLNFRVPSTTSENVIRIRAKGEGKVYLVSLQRGMTWAPAYQVDLLDDKNLTLTAKATILNDLAPIEDVDVNLVTGFPNIRYLPILDPLSSGQSVDQFIQGIAYAVTDKDYKKDALTQNIALSGRSSSFAEAMPATGSGQQLEDLFLYKQPHVSLKQAERGYFILFQSKSTYESVYTVDIPDTANYDQPEVKYGSDSQESLDVWHTLKFKNTAKQPLTTAPVTTMKDGELMGQDLLEYTSSGADTKVRVTKALDIHAETLDEETARERGFIKNERRSIYDRVTLKGTIEITNLKSKTVQTIVTKTATGEIVEAGGSEVRKTPVGLRHINPVSEMTWKLGLKPGETKRLSYSVHVLVPSAE